MPTSLVPFYYALRRYDACMPKSLADFVAEALQTVHEVDCEVVDRARLDQGQMILDVREPDEYAAGHIPGAINIPRGFLEVKADLVHHKRDDRLRDRAQKIICYCGGGNRSALAAKALMEMGFTNVVSMQGGWHEWEDKAKPIAR